MANTDDLIGTVEAARILGVERSTLTRWVQLGRIAEFKKLPGPNGTRLFRRSDVLALLEPAEPADGAA
jgi:excisionase family DNA binding protein